ncbi:MAG TPA: hypothetical protein VD794_07205 [Flavisolibacter sp.]|nr:hypothetical protein [Flavisolibacter sp.]
MSIAFKGANHFIPLEKAKKLKKKFKEKKGQLINPGIKVQDVIPDSETFDRAAIDRLLALPGCVGIRIYTGMDDEDKLHSILVGVNDKGEDLIIPSNTVGLTAENDGVVVEDAVRCPPHCPTDSEIDS